MSEMHEASLTICKQYMANNEGIIGGQPEQTTAPVSVPAKTVFQPITPEFIRLPKNGLCPWTGLSRAKIYELISPNEANGHKAPVKSVSLRKSGAVKGTRLIVTESLLNYLRAQIQGGSAL